MGKKKVVVFIAGMLIAANIIPVYAADENTIQPINSESLISIQDNKNETLDQAEEQKTITGLMANIAKPITIENKVSVGLSLESAIKNTNEQLDVPDIHGIKVSEILKYESALNKAGISRKVFVYSYKNKEFTEYQISISDFVKQFRKCREDIKDHEITWKVRSSFTISNSNIKEKKNSTTVYELIDRKTEEVLMTFSTDKIEDFDNVYIRVIGSNFYILDCDNSEFNDVFVKGFDKDGREKIASALFVLKKNCPEFYEMVMKNREIQYKKGGNYQAEVYPGKPVIYVTEKGVETNITEIAAFLAHEAQHLDDYEKTKKCTEPSAFTTAYKVKKALGKRVDASTIEADKPKAHYSNRDWYDY